MLSAQCCSMNLWQRELALISWAPLYFEFGCEDIVLTGFQLSYSIIYALVLKMPH